MGEEGEETKEEKKETSWVRENIEAVIVAIVLALIIRQFAMEAFVIPTGSMAPTLFGEHIEIACPNCGREFAIDKKRCSGGFEQMYVCTAECPRCKVRDSVHLYDDGGFSDEAEAVCRECGYEWWVKRTGSGRMVDVNRIPLECPNCAYEFCKDIAPSDITGGHKILVNKSGLLVRDPQRWDIIVFKFPLSTPGMERKNYIKRLVGLPGEDILIDEGDIYINGQIARKDLDTIRAMSCEVFNSRLEQKWEKFIPWRSSDNNWTLSVKSLAVTAHKGESHVKFIRPITSAMPYSGSGSARVDDVGFQLTVNCAGEGEFFCTIYNREYKFRLILPVDRKGKARLTMDGVEVASAEACLVPGESYAVEFVNIDDRVLALVDGEEIFKYEYTSGVKRLDRDLEILIGTVGTAAQFSELRLYRDIHYIAQGEHASSASCHIGPGEYFALGDNSANSADSRSWGTVPAQNLLGCAFVIFWPIPQVRFVK